MKKFIGNVNGKSFDNLKDFNEAAAEAIKANDDNLSISSYYSYVDDENKEVPVIEDDKKLSKEDYVIINQKPSVLFGGKVLDYKISDDLKKRLVEASNKKEIHDTSISILDWVNNNIDSDSESVKKLQIEIERLQDELYEKEESVKELRARKNYYNNILEIIGEPKELERVVETKKDDSDFSPNFFYDFLKSIRFI